MILFWLGSPLYTAPVARVPRKVSQCWHPTKSQESSCASEHAGTAQQILSLLGVEAGATRFLEGHGGLTSILANP